MKDPDFYEEFGKSSYFFDILDKIQNNPLELDFYDDNHLLML